MGYEAELDAAVEAVREATRLCRAVREEMVVNASLEKADHSPVTVADFESQALICRRLKDVFPGDPIVAEEDAEELRRSTHSDMLGTIGDYVRSYVPSSSSQDVCDWIDAGNGEVSDRYWTLDPIDGTKGFLRNDQYAVALALIEDGEVKVGVLGCPALFTDLSEIDRQIGVLVTATRDGGTKISHLDSDERSTVRMNTEQDPGRWRFVESVESAHGDHDRQSSIAKAVGIDALSLRMDSQAKYAAVARGVRYLS